LTNLGVKAEITDQLTLGTKPADVTDRGHERCCGDHVHPGDVHQPPDLRRVKRLAGDQPLNRRDLGIEKPDVAHAPLDHL
jgi:hypothetical protein